MAQVLIHEVTAEWTWPVTILLSYFGRVDPAASFTQFPCGNIPLSLTRCSRFVFMRPMLDAHHPNQADQRAPSTPSHLHVLNELVDITADLIRMVHAQVRQQVEFHLPPTDPDAPPPPPPPWPPITEDPIRAVTELSRSLRLTAALVNKLEQPPKPRNNTLQAPGARPIREETDPARLSDAEKNAPIEACEHECESEDSELSEEERLEDAIYRPIVKIVAGICRDTGIGKLYDGHPWKQRFLTELTALATQAAVQTIAAPPPAALTNANFAAPLPDI